MCKKITFISFLWASTLVFVGSPVLSLSKNVARDEVSIESQKVAKKRLRRRWIIGLSIAGTIIGCIGIGALISSVQNRIKSTRQLKLGTQHMIKETAFISSGESVGQGFYEPVLRAQNHAPAIPETPFRKQYELSAPPGGSPGQVIKKHSIEFTQAYYTDWKNFLEQNRPDPLFILGYKLLIAAYDEKIVTTEIYDFVIELCFSYDEVVVRADLQKNQDLLRTFDTVYENTKECNFGKLLKKYMEYLFPAAATSLRSS